VGRRPDLRELWPDLTEDESLAMRASFDGDRSYAKHLSDDDLASALQRVTDKHYLEVHHKTDEG
jgi:hypothetical protein